MTIDITKLVTVDVKRLSNMSSEIDQARTIRQEIINLLDGMQASAMTLGNTARAQVIETAKQGLRDITKTDLSACTTADQMKAVIMLRYRVIASALPADVITAFKVALS